MDFMDAKEKLSPFEDQENLPISSLTIKTSGSIAGDFSLPISPSISISPNLNSPSTVSSSAFVSALQSPYISPRALDPAPDNTSITATTTATTTTVPSPISYSGSHSDDIPTTSYTPPSDRYDFSTDPNEKKPKFSDINQPRISFSFPVPRISLTKSSVPPITNAKLRSCDVYIGFHGQSMNLVRFCKWLKAELELQGIVSFVADRARYSNIQSHEIADRIICSATFGVVVVTASSFLNSHSIEEIRFFSQKKNLIPLLFDTEPCEITRLFEGNPDEKEWKEAFEGLFKCTEFKLETNESNWRSCVSKAVEILKSKLGRKSTGDKESEDWEELPFPRNKYFVGREKEFSEFEAAFFGCCDIQEIDCPRPLVFNAGSSGFSDGFADEDSDAVRTNSRYISLEMRKCKEPTLEAWIEPAVELTINKGRGLQKQRSKHKKHKWSSNKIHTNTTTICINGSSGIGKTEVALEFAYRYCQRYKMVFWVGGEAGYFRQNILNLATKLGLDVSAEPEKERGRIRSFDEQEFEAFQRVKRELFRDVPYLLIIDNLETEKEWWEGKDLHDLIPSNTGATHVIITTRLPKVMSIEPILLQPLALAESLLLLKGKRKKSYSDGESQFLNKFDEKLGRSSFGLWLIGSLLSELDISPSKLFEAIDKISLNENYRDDGFFQSNPFLVKVLMFCFAILDQEGERRNLANRMLLAGSWFAPAPISTSLLANAANKISAKKNKFHRWKRCLALVICGCSRCCLTARKRKNEMDSVMMLVKLGLAKRANRQPGCWIQFHPITQLFARRRGGLPSANAAVLGLANIQKTATSSDHLWASAFLVFGLKNEPSLVQLKAVDMVHFIKKTAIPLAIRSFMTFSRCNSALELLKVCTNVLEEMEKSFVSQIQDWHNGYLCWKKKKKKLKSSQMTDDFVWRDVTLLKATLLETRAKLLLRGGHFDSGEELCRTCISIRTVMYGHNHMHTLAAQETLAKLVRLRSKI